VAGPASSTDGGVALFDGTDGSALKDGGTEDALINGVTVGQSGANTGRNVALGFNVLSSYNGGSTSGYNVAIGYNAGLSVTSGQENVLIGKNAGNSITTGSDNVIIGDTGESITTGSQNVVIGGRLTAADFNGSGVVVVGDFALRSCTGSAAATTAVGKSALTDVTTGIFNSAFGTLAGSDVTTGSDNLFFGAQAGTSVSPFTVTTQTGRLVMGSNTVTNAYIAVSWTVTSDERDKTDFATLSHGLDVVDEIKTFTFKFDRRSNYNVYDDDGNLVESQIPDGTHKSDRTFVGFKAQQVRDVLDAAGFPPDVVVDTEDPDNLKMKETALIPLLINAIKELKARVEALESG